MGWFNNTPTANRINNSVQLLASAALIEASADTIDGANTFVQSQKTRAEGFAARAFSTGGASSDLGRQLKTLTTGCRTSASWLNNSACLEQQWHKLTALIVSLMAAARLLQSTTCHACLNTVLFVRRAWLMLQGPSFEALCSGTTFPDKLKASIV